MKILFVDTYYPDVFQHPSLDPKPASADDRTAALMGLRFGTSDYYSLAFKARGWDAKDIVVNDPVGAAVWVRSQAAGQFRPTGGLSEIAFRRIVDEKPDVVYMQDLSFFRPPQLHELKRQTKAVLSGQISCPWAGDQQLKCFDSLFTSFPHYMERIASIGVDVEFLPIAFGMNNDPVFKTLASKVARNREVTFVGGMGGGNSPGHWHKGTEVFEHLARNVDEFEWWGYGAENLPDSILKQICRGPAWGREMYDIYLNSKIVVNRHGEVAEGFSNNMRMFEATGCGALLLTEDSPNIRFYFEPDIECVTYKDADDLLAKVRFYLKNEARRAEIAESGRSRTLVEHTYDARLVSASEILKERALKRA